MIQRVHEEVGMVFIERVIPFHEQVGFDSLCRVGLRETRPEIASAIGLTHLSRE